LSLQLSIVPPKGVRWSKKKEPRLISEGAVNRS
jgi:hypothetical protein